MLDSTEQWLKDLEEGGPQAEHALRTPDGHCCLGRLCEVFRKTTGRGEWVFVSAASYADADGIAPPNTPSDNAGVAIDHYMFVIDGIKADMVLPSEVQEWAGLQTKSGSKEGSGVVTGLAWMNDHGHSFAEIAAAVRERPHDYLTG